MSGSMGQRAQASAKRTAMGIQAWVAIVAVAALVLFVVRLYVGRPEVKVEGFALIPKSTTCDGGGRVSSKPKASFPMGKKFMLRYTVVAESTSTTAPGCDQLASGSYAQSMGGDFDKAYKAFEAFGMPPARGPVDVRLVTSAPVEVFTAPGARGAVLLGVSDRSPLNPAWALAQVVLAQYNPGLDEDERKRAAWAVSLLAIESATLDPAPEVFGPQLLGTYDAWVAAQAGIEVLRNALSECVDVCDYSKALSTALTEAGEDPKALQQQFVANLAPALGKDVLAVLRSSD